MVGHVLRLPFEPGKGTCPKRVSCTQGFNVGTHKGGLRYACDFSLQIGTEVCAAADGTVVWVQDEFGTGGTQYEHKARANVIAVRHVEGFYSRYVHLLQGSALVKVGEIVKAGTPLGKTGNSGYTTGPHLHFDVVDLIPELTGEISLHLRADNGESQWVTWACTAALFSAPLGRPPINSEIVAADPLTGTTPLQNADAVQGRICFVMRGENDFQEKINHVLDASPAAIVVGNDVADSEVFAMGGFHSAVRVPVVMISGMHATALRSAISQAPSKCLECRLAAGSQGPIWRAAKEPGFGAAGSRIFRGAQGWRENVREESEDSGDGTGLWYQYQTLPIRFLDPGGVKSYIPRSRRHYPQARRKTFWQSCFCCS
eukprot:c12767_g1_i1.p1 GENE.c12767_g1_i1~~c12767_g1_i1.p1  ORF type:complete len:372 (+),score=32.71 c12767_g1_i1:24-1139(+)